MKLSIKKRLATGALAALLVLSSLSLSCAKKNPEPGYKKAFYSAQLVYGVDALGDLFEIFKNGSVMIAASAKAGVGFTEKGLVVADEITKALEEGLPTDGFARARGVVALFKDAIANGVITFKDERAATIYANSIATIEITINLLEAIKANNQPEVASLEAQRNAKVKATKVSTKAAVSVPWYQDAIVRVTQLVTDVQILSPSAAPEIWKAVRAKSAQTHNENQARLAGW